MQGTMPYKVHIGWTCLSDSGKLFINMWQKAGQTWLKTELDLIICMKQQE